MIPPKVRKCIFAFRAKAATHFFEDLKISRTPGLTGATSLLKIISFKLRHFRQS